MKLGLLVYILNQNDKSGLSCQGRNYKKKREKRKEGRERK